MGSINTKDCDLVPDWIKTLIEKGNALDQRVFGGIKEFFSGDSEEPRLLGGDLGEKIDDITSKF